MKRKTYDRRVEKTQESLDEALLTLLQKKPIEKITVTEICRVANINRSTFYLHYKDIEDLYHQAENSLYDAYLRSLERFVEKDTGWLGALVQESEAELTILKETFSFIASHREMASIFMNADKQGKFFSRFYESGKASYLKSIRTRRDLNESLALYYYDFFASGVVGLIRNWMATGMKETPEQMTKFAEGLIRYGSAGMRW